MSGDSSVKFETPKTNRISNHLKKVVNAKYYVDVTKRLPILLIYK
jgi:hypothetical protein